jgi:hypothetical protein
MMACWNQVPRAASLDSREGKRLQTAKRRWRSRVSIPVPPACEAGALPFELHPPFVTLQCSRTTQNHLHASVPKLTPEVGFEPTTFSLGGRRAIHCATQARVKNDHMKAHYRQNKLGRLTTTKKGVEDQGIDPCASCMLSRRSTI